MSHNSWVLNSQNVKSGTEGIKFLDLEYNDS